MYQFRIQVVIEFQMQRLKTAKDQLAADNVRRLSGIIECRLILPHFLALGIEDSCSSRHIEEHLIAPLHMLCKCAAATDFDVVKMRTNRQYVHDISSFILSFFRYISV